MRDNAASPTRDALAGERDGLGLDEAEAVRIGRFKTKTSRHKQITRIAENTQAAHTEPRNFDVGKQAVTLHPMKRAAREDRYHPILAPRMSTRKSNTEASKL